MLQRSVASTGIDLGHHTVKLARMEENAEGEAVLTHWGLRRVEGPDDKGGEGRSRALAELLRELDLKTRKLGRVAAAVGGKDVQVRQVSLPPLSPEELRNALPFEARKHLPLDSIKNPVLDFQLLGESKGEEGKDPAQEVLLVAAPRARRDEVLRILASVGVDPHEVTVEPLPTVNAVLDGELEKNGKGILVVLDLGAQNSMLAAVQPQGGLYTRNLGCTCEHLTGRLQERLGFDLAAAEAMIRDLKGPEGKQAVTVLADLVDGLISEIEETLRFLSVRRRAQQVEHIFLCGGGALMPGLRDRLADAFRVEVAIGDPLGDARISGDSAPDAGERVRLAGAVGLARW